MSDTVPIPPSVVMGSYDIREMSFQNVVDKILRPSGIKMGGFPVEMFIDLTDAEQQKFMCNICYMIANECRCCDNKHVFCRSCILAWSMTFGENSQKCPFCRCQQTEYHVDEELDDVLKEKRVRCPTDGCTFRSPLHVFLQHSHGRTKYSNADVDFSRIQAEQQRFIPLPSLAALEGDNVAAGAMDIRQQLLQGRMMIHQMMMLMHLEMQLRQQALISYQEAHDPAQRMQRLDDVMALNEQLNEVGSILGMLLNAPLDRGAANRLAAATAAGMQSPPTAHHSPPTLGHQYGAPAADESMLLPRFRFRVFDTDSDDDDNDASEVTDLSYAASNVDDADADDDDVFDEGFGRAGSSSSSSLLNSYTSVGLTSSRRHQATSTVSTGMNVTTGVNDAVSRPSAVGGDGADRRQVAATVPASSTSAASNSRLSVVLSRRREQQLTTPRWMTVEQAPSTVTVNELHLPAGVRSAAQYETTAQQTVTLPQIPSAASNVASASQTPVTQTGGRVQPAVARRQLTGSLSCAGVSVSSSNSPRQLEPLSTNRSSRVVHGNTSGETNGQQMLPTSSHVVASGISDASSSGGINASQQPDRRHPPTDSSGVLTEPWPVLPTTELHPSVSANRDTIAHRAARHNDSRPTHTQGSLARSSRPVAGATVATRGPRRAVQELSSNRPALQLRRSSVRNSLSRPAGPASVSTLHPSAPHSPRMVPLPHPPVRAARQQSLGNHGTAGSMTQASSDMLRPRRRSEIAREIMFPSDRGAEQ